MLILIPLTIMIFLSILTVILGNDWSSIGASSSFGGSNSEGTFNVGTTADFSIDPLIGAIAIIIIIVGICAIIGIRLLDSGLSDQSQRTLTIGITYIGLWSLFSAMGEPLIRAIPSFGALIYIGLTIMYAIGVIQKIQGVKE